MNEWWDVPDKCCVEHEDDSEGTLVRIKTKKGVATVCI